MPKFLKEITFSGQTTPSTPNPGYGSLYVDGTTNLLYYIDDGGVTYDLTSGGSGDTNTYITGATYANNTFTYTNNTGGTFNVLFNTVTGLTSSGTISSNIISATTYQNLPTDIRVTGGTYSGGTATFTNNTGGTFNVIGFQNWKWYAENSTPPAISPSATGSGSIALGNNAAADGIEMFVYGTSSGYLSNNASFSNFIGFNTGYDARNAQNSNFIGTRSGFYAANAVISNFIGNNAGCFATDSCYSNFIGNNAGAVALNATYSNFIGHRAGDSATNANNSNIIGTNSGYYATNACYSNFIGNSAGNSATNACYSNFIGNSAGFDATNASYSTLIGFNAGKDFIGNTISCNNIIIGTNISVPNNCRNKLNIGGTLFGSNFYFNANIGDNPYTGVQDIGKIGIGVVEPTNTLHISATTNPLRIEGLITSANTEFLTISPTGIITKSTGGTSIDTFVTGFTYNNANTLRIQQNNAQPDLTASINVMTGLTIIGNLSATTIDTTYIDFVPLTVRPAYSEARVYWYDDEKTLELQTENANFNLEVGHQTVVRVRNTTGSPLAKGSLVYINGGSGNNPTVTLASYEADTNSARTLGFLGTNINPNGFGYVITNGMLRDVNTSAYSAGTQLYLFTGGTYTNVRPIAPLHEVRVGIVIRQSATVGIIFVSIMNGYELGELHDVRVSGATNNDLLQYNSSISAWTNTQDIQITSLTAGTISATTYQNLPYGVAGINNQTVTAYTFSISDYGDLVTFSSSTFVQATVPTNLSVPFPIGTQIMLSQFGPGQLRVTGDTGVTLFSYGNAYNLVGQYSTAFLTKQATNTWILDGNLTTLNL